MIRYGTHGIWYSTVWYGSLVGTYLAEKESGLAASMLGVNVAGHREPLKHQNICYQPNISAVTKKRGCGSTCVYAGLRIRTYALMKIWNKHFTAVDRSDLTCRAVTKKGMDGQINF